ncbi:MAG: endopeptidase La [Ruminococcaceae bacterium]|nr:endopeptidase La [Oscillospiraceae bacterium]
MSKFTESVERLTLPVVALKDTVAFPGEIINCELRKDSFNSIEAARDAAKGTGYIILVPIKPASDVDSIDGDILFNVGTVARIKQLIKSADGGTRIIAEGLSRASLISYRPTGKYNIADVMAKTVILANDGGIRGEAYAREMIHAVEEIANIIPALASGDVMSTAKSIRNPAQLADFIASHILEKIEDKLDVLAIFEPYARIETLIEILAHEGKILSYEAALQKKTRERIAKGQKEYYLREEMKAIQEELGEGASDTDEYYDRIMDADMPEEVRKKLLKENEKLAKTPFGSAESTVLTNYLDTCLELPWGKKTDDRADVSAAREILDADHEGLEDVKKRLLEYLAVKQLNPSLKGQIICLYGPPGVGKTSIAASLARAMNRKYVRVSLGGVRDEADIRGHRKTYVGAMPGRIINALISAESSNPLILLDEIDKMASDGRGDPASALLEALDPEQNKFFRDHFIELPFDLSECIFIATANTLETVARPLIDRMEIIELHTYTKSEKTAIAKNHLIPRQLKRHGLNKRTLRITDEALSKIIDAYTRESGVRNLERELACLCRRAALNIIDGKCKSMTVTPKNLESLLGAEKFLPEKISDRDEIGAVNGLAYTQSGGDMLKIEVAVTDGTGKLELTGNLGDVMKESAKAALTYARQIASKYGIPTDFYSKKDIHIHVPEGAVPKDGPSAGVTMLTALVSALSGIPVRRDVAMTGEITLRGNVLAIGGLREKTMAAYAAGVTTVLIPHDNIKDIDKLDALVKENITFVPCKHASDVLYHALACVCEDIPQRIPTQKDGYTAIPAAPSHTTEIHANSKQ